MSFLKQQMGFSSNFASLYIMSKSYKVSAKKSMEELFLMTLKSDTKFKEKLT